jgi:Phage integrase, N-terminal SAM-like domain
VKVIATHDSQTMATALIPTIVTETSNLARLNDSARQCIQHAKSTQTLKPYEADWEDFTSFWRRTGFTSLAARPETMALYLAKMADEGHKPPTISRRLAAVSKMHSTAGYESRRAMRHACVKESWDGITSNAGLRPEPHSLYEKSIRWRRLLSRYKYLLE